VKPIRVLSAPIAEVMKYVEIGYPKPDFEYVAELTLEGAVKRLDEPFDVIACSVHFDNWQVYDFLRLAKAHPKAKHIPFLVIHTGKEVFSKYICQSVEIASHSLGAEAVIPLSRWHDELGVNGALKKYQDFIRSVVNRQSSPELP
jgi:hypothetical protein